jgi:SAM-dependent methyltransferase
VAVACRRETTVVDISAKALELSRRAFGLAGCHGLVAAVLRLRPDPALGGRDLVFNSGLIEHFHRADQIRLLESMRDLVRPGGHVIVVAPLRGGATVSVGQAPTRAARPWRFGDEVPLMDDEGPWPAGGARARQRGDGKPGDQLNFLAGVMPRVAMIGKVAYLLTLADLTPLWRLVLGDSMIATTFRRPDSRKRTGSGAGAGAPVRRNPPACVGPRSAS